MEEKSDDDDAAGVEASGVEKLGREMVETADGEKSAEGAVALRRVGDNPPAPIVAPWFALQLAKRPAPCSDEKLDAVAGVAMVEGAAEVEEALKDGGTVKEVLIAGCDTGTESVAVAVAGALLLSVEDAPAADALGDLCAMLAIMLCHWLRTFSRVSSSVFPMTRSSAFSRSSLPRSATPLARRLSSAACFSPTFACRIPACCMSPSSTSRCCWTDSSSL